LSDVDDAGDCKLLHKVSVRTSYLGKDILLNLLMVFYSIGVSSLVTLVLYTITHLEYNPLFLLET